jgi:DnaK suppressor protein
MIVSLLQLMGFPMGKPVHSRAEEVPPPPAPKGSGGQLGRNEHSQAGSARRQDVKAKSGKDNKAKTVKAVKGKTEVKAASKANVKKVPAKAPAKAAVKPAKPVAKAAVKAAPKTIPKTPVKSVPKKSAAKSPAKAPVKATTKTTAKPAAKVTPKTPVKSAAKPTPVATAKPTTKTAAKAAPKLVTKEKTADPMTLIATKSAPIPAAPIPPAIPQKTGRPSSRLAQLTVPSMAQSVASTAAKASYSQVVLAPVIVPVLPSSIKKDPKLADNWKTKPANELTDAELMAMPDAEYMNEAQLAAFKHRLSVLKRDILNSAGETTEHLREDTSVVPDPADRATIEEEHALELRTRDRERKLLKKIEQSIGRIDSGDYGYCDETGEPFGVGRLLARPTASLSLEAQQRRELKQKMFGD